MREARLNKQMAGVLGCAVLALVGAGGARAQAESAPTTAGSMNYQTEVRYAVIGLDIAVNGIPVESDAAGSAGGGGELLNLFLLDEPNRITITLHPAKGAAARGPEAFAVVSVNAYGEARTSKLERVYHFEWRQTKPPKALPGTVTGTLPSVKRARPLSWQGAPRVTVDAGARAAIAALIGRYHDALAAKDLPRVRALLVTSTRDAALALGQSVPDTEASQKRQFGGDFSGRSWRMKPVDYPHLRYRACAGGRLISVEDPDGSAPLSSAPDKNGSTSQFNVRVAFLNGQWTLL